MRTELIEKLVALCCEQPFDVVEIQRFITENALNSEEVTKASIDICEYGNFDYGYYLYDNEKEPNADELKTYNWDKLFDVLIDNGLDATLVFCYNGKDYENILDSIRYIDNGTMGASILRNVLNKGGDPNIEIDSHPFFEEIDSDFVMDIDMNLFDEKWRLDVAFRFWIVLIGFGGYIKDHQCPVKMKNGFSTDIFKDFEKFDYRIDRNQKDWTMYIFLKENSTVVATL